MRRFYYVAFVFVAVAGSVFLMSSSQAFAATDGLVSVRVESPTETVVDVSIPRSVDGCDVEDEEGQLHHLEGSSALCALTTALQWSGRSATLTASDFGLLLTAIDDVQQTDETFWLFRVNDQLAQEGLGTYQIQADDRLVVSFGEWPSSPLSLTVSEGELLLGDEVSVEVQLFDDQAQKWKPASSARVVMGEQSVSVDTEGMAKLAPSVSGSFRVVAEQEGFTRSAPAFVQVYDRYLPEELPAKDRAQMQERALAFLRSTAQANDGLVESSGVTAWSAMALSSSGQSVRRFGSDQQRMIDVVAKTIDADLAITDWERSVLAIVAMGEDPHTFSGHDWVRPIRSSFSEGQLGEPLYVNDDIFGVLALLAAQEEVATKEITGALNTILDAQRVDGGFAFSSGVNKSDTDTTAAAIQALVAYRDHGGTISVEAALRSARRFLQQQQRLDGGFAYESGQASNAASTAWALQAISALGERSSGWTKNHRTPVQFLMELQQEDGSFAWTKEQPGSALITAYVALALLEQPLFAFPEEPFFVVSPDQRGGPQVVVKDAEWVTRHQFFAFSEVHRSGVRTAIGDVDGDGQQEIVAVQGSGTIPEVRTFSVTGQQESSFLAFDQAFRGGLFVELADIDGDHVQDIVISPEQAGGPHVRVFSAGGDLRTEFFAYEEMVRGGVRVRAGDVDGDGDDELVTVPASFGGPHVRVFDGDGSSRASFFSFNNKQLRGGYHLAVGDVTGDGLEEIVLAPRAGMGAHINIFSGEGVLRSGFFAFENFLGGVHVSLGDLNRDGVQEIVATPEVGQPHVRAFSFDGTERASFYAYDPSLTDVGMRATIVDASADGTNEFLVLPASDRALPARVLSPYGATLSQFWSHGEGFFGSLELSASPGR